MTFAGKYDEPDYELLVGDDCDLAIESTMILHAPKVQEMIETLGIPVFTDRSSYDSQPLGSYRVDQALWRNDEQRRGGKDLL